MSLAPQEETGPLNSFTSGMGSTEVQNPEMDTVFKRKNLEHSLDRYGTHLAEKKNTVCIAPLTVTHLS